MWMYRYRDTSIVNSGDRFYGQCDTGYSLFYSYWVRVQVLTTVLAVTLSCLSSLAQQGQVLVLVLGVSVPYGRQLD
jgi:hypothetical protein